MPIVITEKDREGMQSKIGFGVSVHVDPHYPLYPTLTIYAKQEFFDGPTYIVQRAYSMSVIPGSIKGEIIDDFISFAKEKLGVKMNKKTERETLLAKIKMVLLGHNTPVTSWPNKAEVEYKDGGYSFYSQCDSCKKIDKEYKAQVESCCNNCGEKEFTKVIARVFLRKPIITGGFPSPHSLHWEEYKYEVKED